jgi:hypothetical protein
VIRATLRSFSLLTGQYKATYQSCALGVRRNS